jgi:uncharacterized protein YjbI with pentapeptide repeats
LKGRFNDTYENWDERSALHRWTLVCGASVMDVYLFNFVMDEMRLHQKQNPDDVVAWQQTLSDLFSFMLRQGMPMERIIPRLDFYEEKKQARNSEEALLAVLNSCARVNECITNIDWLTSDSFGNWVLTLQKQRTGHENVLALHCFSFLNLQRCILHVKDFHYANFSKANLEGVGLVYSHLVRALFLDTNLQMADLGEANLSGANLKRANLRRANLEGANLSGANLEGTNLSGANLEGANLSGANLEGANLEGAKLEGANLEGVNLENANLILATLRGANLVGTNLEEAFLENVETWGQGAIFNEGQTGA